MKQYSYFNRYDNLQKLEFKIVYVKIHFLILYYIFYIIYYV